MVKTIMMTSRTKAKTALKKRTPLVLTPMPGMLKVLAQSSKARALMMFIA